MLYEALVAYAICRCNIQASSVRLLRQTEHSLEMFHSFSGRRESTMAQQRRQGVSFHKKKLPFHLRLALTHFYTPLSPTYSGRRDDFGHLSCSEWRRNQYEEAASAMCFIFVCLSLCKQWSEASSVLFPCCLRGLTLAASLFSTRSLRTVTVTTESGGTRLFVETAVPYFRWVQGSHACRGRACETCTPSVLQNINIYIFKKKQTFIVFLFNGVQIFSCLCWTVQESI